MPLCWLRNCLLLAGIVAPTAVLALYPLIHTVLYFGRAGAAVPIVSTYTPANLEKSPHG